MKKITILFLLFCFTSAHSQIQKLGELSSGKFLDSSVIMEEDESDVFGYCLLYESNRKSKEIFDLEYVILDKNLNKLTSASITQTVFKTWMAGTRAEITFAKKIGNQLTVALNDRLNNFGIHDLMRRFNYRFINLNLEDFTFSKEFKYEDFTKTEFDYDPGDKLSIDDIWNLQKLVKTKSKYLLSFATPEKNPKAAAISDMGKFEFKRDQSVKRFAILDKDLNIVWSKDINKDKKTASRYEYLDSDDEILLLKKEIMIKKAAPVVKSIEAYNINTGELLGEMQIEDDKYNINLYSVSITNNEVHVFTNTYQRKKKGRNLGHGHLVFDKKSLIETKRNFILWENLAQLIPGINAYGMFGKKEWIMAQDFIVTPKGNVLMIAEAYGVKSKGSNMIINTNMMYAILKDMYIIEFNQDNSIAFSKKIKKSNSVEVPLGIHALTMKEYGVFDYIFCQKINPNGDFIMYYTLNDQAGNKRKMAKKPLWTLGFVSNIDGEYSFDTLPLYGDDSKIYPGLAKNGYIRLLEVNQKTNQAEMRIEKINF